MAEPWTDAQAPYKEWSFNNFRFREAVVMGDKVKSRMDVYSNVQGNIRTDIKTSQDIWVRFADGNEDRICVGDGSISLLSGQEVVLIEYADHEGESWESVYLYIKNTREIWPINDKHLFVDRQGGGLRLLVCAVASILIGIIQYFTKNNGFNAPVPQDSFGFVLALFAGLVIADFIFLGIGHRFKIASERDRLKDYIILPYMREQYPLQH